MLLMSEGFLDYIENITSCNIVNEMMFASLIVNRCIYNLIKLRPFSSLNICIMTMLYLMFDGLVQVLSVKLRCRHPLTSDSIVCQLAQFIFYNLLYSIKAIKMREETFSSLKSTITNENPFDSSTQILQILHEYVYSYHCNVEKI